MILQAYTIVNVREMSNIPMSYLDPFCLLVLEIIKEIQDIF